MYLTHSQDSLLSSLLSFSEKSTIRLLVFESEYCIFRSVALVFTFSIPHSTNQTYDMWKKDIFLKSFIFFQMSARPPGGLLFDWASFWCSSSQYWHSSIECVLFVLHVLNIRDPFDLRTTLCSLTVSLVACLFLYGLLS